MSSTDKVIQKLKELKVPLVEKYPISKLALFGSYSRADHNANSDIDILVEIDGKIGSRFIDLADELEKYLGQKVDLISKNGIKPAYYNSIKEDLIYV